MIHIRNFGCSATGRQPGSRLRSLVMAGIGFTMAIGTAVVGHAQPKPGGTVVAAVGEPSVINPSFGPGTPELVVGCMVYDGLVRNAWNFKLVPGLASSWEISPDGRIYTFHLREAKWHDGKPFTSEDVKFSLLEISAKYGAAFASAGSAIDTIETPDPRTAIIKLSRPFGPFLFSLSCEQNGGIMPAHLYRGTDILKNPHNASPIGTGAFKFNEWVRGDHITLDRNPDYWQSGKPYLDRIVVKFIQDGSARILALRANEVDFIDQYFFPLNGYRVLENNKRFQLRNMPYPLDDVILLNTKRPPIDKPKVRQALLTAIDREFLQKNVFFGLGGIAKSAIDSRITWAYNPAIDYNKMYAYSPEKARALLDEAGVMPGPDGVRFTVHLVFFSERSDYLQWAQALQQFWGAIGVKVVLDSADRAVTIKRVFNDYDYDATFQALSTSNDPALGIARIYTTESIRRGVPFSNATGYSNPEVDELFAKGAASVSEEERGKYYYKVQEILARDLPALNIHELANIDAASAKLQDLDKGARHVFWDSVWLKD